MTLSFEQLPQPDSPLRRLDPRWKLAALVLAAACAAALGTPAPSLLLLAGALLLATLGRLPLRWYLQRLAAVALFLVPFAVVSPFVGHHQGPTWTWGPLHVSLSGLLAAVVISAKALTIVTLVLVVLVTAPLDATCKAAHALRVPGFLVQLVMLTYRYLFVVAEELARLRVALRVRGYRNRMNRHSYHTAGSIAGTLLVRSHERAQRVGQALRCRGFDGRFRSLAEFHTTLADVGVFVATVAVAGGALAWDLVTRWSAAP